MTESFVIRDASGQALAHVYFEDEDGRRKVMKRLTRDEARRIAASSRVSVARTASFSYNAPLYASPIFITPP